MRTASGPPPWIEVRSAPAARMNGLPVTASASIVVVGQRRVDRRVEREQRAGPKVLGLVWSSPLSRVIRPIVAPGQGDPAQVGLRHALGVGDDRLRALEER